MNLYLGLVIFLVNLACLKASNSTKQPHIIIIYADDLGWNDVSYHGSPQIPTPNIDSMALSGIALENYYAEWLCTPSRAALLTGKYPMRLGLQHSVILGSQASGLPLNETIMPQYFKEVGYETHMIGKWHLGYQSKEYTPTYRGFDSHLGYWNGMIDYFDHTYLETFCTDIGQNLYGADLHDGLTPVKDAQGKYATHLFTERAEEIILNHNTSKPLFMFFAHLAAHSGNDYQQPQCPGDVVSEFMYIPDVSRRIHAGVVHEMDQSVGDIFEVLNEMDMLKNSIILFLSDNGGQVDPAWGSGSNYPLRGNKGTYWEGGIHVPAVIWSPLLNLKKPRVSHQLMHVSDWLPTLYNLIGGNLNDLEPIDGIDMWQALLDDTPSPRTDVLQNLDPISGTSAFRMGDMKLTNGSLPGEYNYWYSPEGLEDFNGPSIYEWVFKNGSTVKYVLEQRDMWMVDDPNKMYEELHLTCNEPLPKNFSKCDSGKACLFNITADPCEFEDVSDEYPDMVNEMWQKILQYQSEEMEPQNKPCDPSGNPMCHKFQYVTWLDPDQYRECNFLSKGNQTTTN